MPRVSPFDKHAAAYDRWFDDNQRAYESELAGVRSLLPPHTRAVEIGVGTGRFAAPLGIKIGLEPSPAMARLARARGVHVVEGLAESLPFADDSFDLALMVTVVAFLDDVETALHQVYRVLRKGGVLLIGLLDRETELGRKYETYKSENPFYQAARLRSSEELLQMATAAGFTDPESAQTIFAAPGDGGELEPVDPGFGRGLFAVHRVRKFSAPSA